jgi:phosphoglycolate phosphatase
MVSVLDEYDFWLFDLDGTLVDVEWSYVRRTFDRVGDRLGRRFSDSEAELLWYGLCGARDAQLREWGIEPGSFWPAFHAVEEPQVRAEATYLHDDADTLLARLDRRDVPVGVVTHCQRFLADPVLDELDLRGRFDAVVCCDEDLGWKPDPAPVERTLQEMGLVEPRVATDGGTVPLDGRGVLAGDGASDVGAAWNAGLDGVHVERHGHDRRGRCVLADYRVSSFDELPL